MSEPEAAAPRRRRFPWREFWILTVAGVAGTILVLPYALTLQAPLLRRVPPRIPLAALLAIQTIQTAILIAIAVAVGLVLGHRLGLGAPLLERWLAGERVRDRIWPVLRVAIPAGIVASLIILALDAGIFAPRLPTLTDAAAAHPPAWQGLLASFYGATTEELLLRFGVLTLLAWLIGKVRHDAQGRPTTDALWIANLLAAVLFGIGHLPATAAILPLTGLVVARAILLNGIPGVIFGWLYFTRGLEAAMAAHFCGDLVLHVIAPLV